MDRARVIHELSKISLVCTFRFGTHGIDRVIELAPVALLTSLEIVAPGFVVVAMSILTSFTGLIVVTASVARAHSPFCFFHINVAIGYTNEFSDGAWALLKQCAKLFVAKSFGEGGNGLCVGDIRYGVSRF
jgi:hypothetical protein